MPNFFKIMMAATAFLNWAQQASADGKIDTDEAIALVKMILSILGIKAEIAVDPIVPDANDAVLGVK